MPITIDTLAAQRTMESAGIQPTHAEAIVTVFAHRGEPVATKADIDRLERRLEVEIGGRLPGTTGPSTSIDGLTAAVATLKTECFARMDAFEARVETMLDAKFDAFEKRFLAAMLAFGGLLYAALRIF